jgi:hypothetical protein
MLHLKRRFGKGATIAAASAALIAGTAGIAAASASGPNITRAITMRLRDFCRVAHPQTASIVN